MSGGEIALGMGGLFAGYLQYLSGQNAAEATTQASAAQLAAQQEALNYLKKQQAVPSAYAEEARVKLGQLYGLQGNDSFISGLDKGPTGIPTPGLQNTGITRIGGLLPGLSTGTNLGDLGIRRYASAANKSPFPKATSSWGNVNTPGTFAAYTGPGSSPAKPYLESYKNPPPPSQSDAALEEWNNLSYKDKEWLLNVVGQDELKRIHGIDPNVTLTLDGYYIGKVGDTGKTTSPTGEPIGANTVSGEWYQHKTQQQAQQELIDQAKASPLYSSLLSGREAGEESLLRNQSAIGKLRSGSSAHALYDYNTQLQNNALMTSYNQQLAGLNQMAGLPTDFQSIATLMSNMGATQAAGISGSAQAGILGTQNALNGIMGILGQGLSKI